MEKILDVLSGIIGEPDDIDEAVNLVKELLYLFIEKSENGVEDNFLSHSILLACAKVVLSMKFSRIDDETKDELINSINKAMSFHTAGSILYDLKMIHYLVNNHWDHPILSAILAEDEIDSNEAEVYLSSEEDPDILLLRVQLLAIAGCLHEALSLCKWCLKCSRFVGNLNLEQFHLVLLHKLDLKEEFHSACMQIPCCKAMRIFDLMCKEKTIADNESRQVIIQAFVIKDWENENSICCSRVLLQNWLSRENLNSEFMQNLQHLVATSVSVEKLLILLEEVYERFGDEIFELCSDQCLIVARNQRRQLDGARTFKNIHKAEEAMRRLALACKTISVLYKKHPQMCLMSCITSFYLNPSQQLFDQLASMFLQPVPDCKIAVGPSSIHAETYKELFDLVDSARPASLQPHLGWDKIKLLMTQYLKDVGILSRHSEPLNNKKRSKSADVRLLSKETCYSASEAPGLSCITSQTAQGTSSPTALKTNSSTNGGCEFFSITPENPPAVLLTCRFCHELFDSISKRRCHEEWICRIRADTSSTDADAKLYPCTLCSHRFTNKNSVRRHMLDRHPYETAEADYQRQLERQNNRKVRRGKRADSLSDENKKSENVCLASSGRDENAESASALEKLQEKKPDSISLQSISAIELDETRLVLLTRQGFMQRLRECQSTNSSSQSQTFNDLESIINESYVIVGNLDSAADFVCDLCKKSCKVFSSLKSHIQSVHGQDIATVNANARSVSLFNILVYTFGIKQCVFCAFSSDCVPDLFSHWLRHYPKTVLSPSKQRTMQVAQAVVENKLNVKKPEIPKRVTGRGNSLKKRKSPRNTSVTQSVRESENLNSNICSSMQNLETANTQSNTSTTNCTLPSSIPSEQCVETYCSYGTTSRAMISHQGYGPHGSIKGHLVVPEDMKHLLNCGCGILVKCVHAALCSGCLKLLDPDKAEVHSDVCAVSNLIPFPLYECAYCPNAKFISLHHCRRHTLCDCSQFATLRKDRIFAYKCDLCPKISRCIDDIEHHLSSKHCIGADQIGLYRIVELTNLRCGTSVGVGTINCNKLGSTSRESIQKPEILKPESCTNLAKTKERLVELLVQKRAGLEVNLRFQNTASDGGNGSNSVVPTLKLKEEKTSRRHRSQSVNSDFGNKVIISEVTKTRSVNNLATETKYNSTKSVDNLAVETNYDSTKSADNFSEGTTCYENVSASVNSTNNDVISCRRIGRRKNEIHYLLKDATDSWLNSPSKTSDTNIVNDKVIANVSANVGEKLVKLRRKSNSKQEVNKLMNSTLQKSALKFVRRVPLKFIESSKEESANGINSTEIPVKRSRGRPRKYPLGLKHHQALLKPEQRGRPRKYPQGFQHHQLLLKSEQRGRPCKYPLRFHRHQVLLKPEHRGRPRKYPLGFRHHQALLKAEQMKLAGKTCKAPLGFRYLRGNLSREAANERTRKDSQQSQNNTKELVQNVNPLNSSELKDVSQSNGREACKLPCVDNLEMCVSTVNDVESLNNSKFVDTTKVTNIEHIVSDEASNPLCVPLSVEKAPEKLYSENILPPPSNPQTEEIPVRSPKMSVKEVPKNLNEVDSSCVIINNDAAIKNAIRPVYRVVAPGLTQTLVRNMYMFSSACYQCRYCNEKVLDRMHTVIHKCPARPVDAIGPHFLVKDKQYLCFYCMQEYNDRIECWKHMMEACSAVPEGARGAINVFKCPYCQRKHYNFWGLQRHASRIHDKLLRYDPTKGLIEMDSSNHKTLSNQLRQQARKVLKQSRKIIPFKSRVNRFWRGNKLSHVQINVPEGISIWSTQKTLEKMELENDAILCSNCGAFNKLCFCNSCLVCNDANEKCVCKSAWNEKIELSQIQTSAASKFAKLCHRHMKQHLVNLLRAHVKTCTLEKSVKCCYCELENDTLRGCFDHLCHSHPSEFGEVVTLCPECEHESFSEEYDLKRVGVVVQRAGRTGLKLQRQKLCPLRVVVNVPRLSAEFRPGCVTTINLADGCKNDHNENVKKKFPLVSSKHQRNLFSSNMPGKKRAILSKNKETFRQISRKAKLCQSVVCEANNKDNAQLAELVECSVHNEQNASSTTDSVMHRHDVESTCSSNGSNDQDVTVIDITTPQRFSLRHILTAGRQIVVRRDLDLPSLGVRYSDKEKSHSNTRQVIANESLRVVDDVLNREIALTEGILCTKPCIEEAEGSYFTVEKESGIAGRKSKGVQIESCCKMASEEFSSNVLMPSMPLKENENALEKAGEEEIFDFVAVGTILESDDFEKTESLTCDELNKMDEIIAITISHELLKSFSSGDNINCVTLPICKEKEYERQDHNLMDLSYCTSGNINVNEIDKADVTTVNPEAGLQRNVCDGKFKSMSKIDCLANKDHRLPSLKSQMFNLQEQACHNQQKFIFHELQHKDNSNCAEENKRSSMQHIVFQNEKPSQLNKAVQLPDHLSGTNKDCVVEVFNQPVEANKERGVQFGRVVLTKETEPAIQISDQPVGVCAEHRFVALEEFAIKSPDQKVISGKETVMEISVQPEFVSKELASEPPLSLLGMANEKKVFELLKQIKVGGKHTNNDVSDHFGTVVESSNHSEVGFQKPVIEDLNQLTALNENLEVEIAASSAALANEKLAVETCVKSLVPTQVSALSLDTNSNQSSVEVLSVDANPDVQSVVTTDKNVSDKIFCQPTELNSGEKASITDPSVNMFTVLSVIDKETVHQSAVVDVESVGQLAVVDARTLVQSAVIDIEELPVANSIRYGDRSVPTVSTSDDDRSKSVLAAEEYLLKRTCNNEFLQLDPAYAKLTAEFIAHDEQACHLEGSCKTRNTLESSDHHGLLSSCKSSEHLLVSDSHNFETGVSKSSELLQANTDLNQVMPFSNKWPMYEPHSGDKSSLKEATKLGRNLEGIVSEIVHVNDVSQVSQLVDSIRFASDHVETSQLQEKMSNGEQCTLITTEEVLLLPTHIPEAYPTSVVSNAKDGATILKVGNQLSAVHNDKEEPPATTEQCPITNSNLTFAYKTRETRPTVKHKCKKRNNKLLKLCMKERTVWESNCKEMMTYRFEDNEQSQALFTEENSSVIAKQPALQQTHSILIAEEKLCEPLNSFKEEVSTEPCKNIQQLTYISPNDHHLYVESRGTDLVRNADLNFDCLDISDSLFKNDPEIKKRKRKSQSSLQVNNVITKRAQRTTTQQFSVLQKVNNKPESLYDKSVENVSPNITMEVTSVENKCNVRNKSTCSDNDLTVQLNLSSSEVATSKERTISTHELVSINDLKLFHEQQKKESKKLERFQSMQSLQKYKNEATGSYQCPTCPSVFPKIPAFMYHLQQIHKVQVSTDANGFQCPICMTKFQCSADFQLHMRVQHKVRSLTPSPQVTTVVNNLALLKASKECNREKFESKCIKNETNDANDLAVERRLTGEFTALKSKTIPLETTVMCNDKKGMLIDNSHSQTCCSDCKVGCLWKDNQNIVEAVESNYCGDVKQIASAIETVTGFSSKKRKLSNSCAVAKKNENSLQKFKHACEIDKWATMNDNQLDNQLQGKSDGHGNSIKNDGQTEKMTIQPVFHDSCDLNFANNLLNYNEKHADKTFSCKALQQNADEFVLHDFDECLQNTFSSTRTRNSRIKFYNTSDSKVNSIGSASGRQYVATYATSKSQVNSTDNNKKCRSRNKVQKAACSRFSVVSNRNSIALLSNTSSSDCRLSDSSPCTVVSSNDDERGNVLHGMESSTKVDFFRSQSLPPSLEKSGSASDISLKCGASPLTFKRLLSNKNYSRKKNSITDYNYFNDMCMKSVTTCTAHCESTQSADVMNLSDPSDICRQNVTDVAGNSCIVTRSKKNSFQNRSVLCCSNFSDHIDSSSKDNVHEQATATVTKTNRQFSKCYGVRNRIAKRKA